MGSEIVWLEGREVLGDVLGVSGLVRRRLDGGLIEAASAEVERTSGAASKKTLDARISTSHRISSAGFKHRNCGG